MKSNNTNRIFAEIERQIQFYDVDMMEFVWHGHYVKYFEEARCALLDRIDYNYRQMKESGYAWPVIELKIRYPASIGFEQKIRVRAELLEYENYLKIGYQIFDTETNKKLTKGYTTQVAVRIEDKEMMLASPQILLDRIAKVSNNQ